MQRASYGLGIILANKDFVMTIDLGLDAVILLPMNASGSSGAPTLNVTTSCFSLAGTSSSR
jgi:hypothetical protein